MSNRMSNRMGNGMSNGLCNKEVLCKKYIEAIETFDEEIINEMIREKYQIDEPITLRKYGMPYTKAVIYVFMSGKADIRSIEMLLKRRYFTTTQKITILSYTLRHMLSEQRVCLFIKYLDINDVGYDCYGNNFLSYVVMNYYTHYRSSEHAREWITLFIRLGVDPFEGNHVIFSAFCLFLSEYEEYMTVLRFILLTKNIPSHKKGTYYIGYVLSSGVFTKNTYEMIQLLMHKGCALYTGVGKSTQYLEYVNQTIYRDAQIKISRWWIPICYKLKNEKGEYRMAVRGWKELNF